MTASFRSAPSRGRLWWRMVWAALLLVHAPATVSVISRAWGVSDASETAWESFLLLTAANLFFILEIAFAPSIRLVQDRRGVVAMLVVVALLHVGVVDRSLPAFFDAAEARCWLLLAGTVAMTWRWLRAGAAALLDRESRSVADAARHRRQPRYAWAAAAMRPPPLPDAAWLALPGRAPPSTHS